MKTTIIETFAKFGDLFNRYTKERESSELGYPILLFVANDDPVTKKSWCPDCVLAKPIIDKMLDKYSNNDKLLLAYVQVGQRNEWKTPDNPYRLHELKISCVPTIVSLRNNLRLNGSECSDEAKVAKLFSGTL